MNSLQRLEEIFSHFPGIGPRQARRFVYYLLTKSPSSIKEFTDLVNEVKGLSRECSKCHRYYIENRNNIIASKQELSICSVCRDPNRDGLSIMIVARDSDFESVEKSGAFKGLYFILGGTVPILDKEPEKRIRLKLLLERVSEAKNLKEIILSLNTTPEGENTTSIVKDAVMRVVDLDKVKVSVLGRGLSTGAELEYADEETIRNAMVGRKPIGNNQK